MKRIILLIIAFSHFTAHSQEPKLLLTLSGHTDKVYSSTFSPDGQKVVTASGDSTAKIWSAQTGALLTTLRGHTYVVYSAAFSPDGQKVVTASGDDTAKIWSAQTGALLTTLGGHTETVRSAAFSSGGQMVVTASDDHTAKIWNTQTGALLTTLRGHTGFVWSAAFSPDGQKVVTASSEGTAIIWSAQTGIRFSTLSVCKFGVNSAAFSPDGQKVVTTSWDGAKIWSAKTGETLTTLSTNTDWVQAAFSPDGQMIVAASWDGTAKIWNTQTGALLTTLNGNKKSGANSAAFSPDGKIVVVSTGKTAKIWQISNDGLPSEKRVTNETYNTPPQIIITNPTDVTANSHNMVQEGEVTITGNATDPSGIYVVKVNNQEVTLDARGNFQYKAKLPYGDTKVEVYAEDMKNNNTTLSFTLSRYSRDVSIPAVADKGIIIENKKEENTITKTGNYYAIIIAEQDYNDHSIQRLTFPVADARKLASTLKSNYLFDSILLIPNASRSRIMNTLYAFRRNLNTEDNLLIFYSGHGYWDAENEQGYWLPADAMQDAPSTWISNSDIKDQVKPMKCNHTLLISDACFAGSIFKTRVARMEKASKTSRELYKTKSRKAMTSGTLTEVPDESMFLKYMVIALEANKEPFLPSESLFNLFRENAINNTNTNIKPTPLPQFGVIADADDEGGDFIFIRKQ